MTDVIGVGPLLFSIGTCRVAVREAHHDNDGQPPFRSATKPMVQENLAQTLHSLSYLTSRWIALVLGGNNRVKTLVLMGSLP